MKTDFVLVHSFREYSLVISAPNGDENGVDEKFDVGRRSEVVMCDKNYTMFSIGEEFPIQLRGEIIFYLIGGCPSLIYNFSSPTPDEIDSVQNGNLSVSLFESKDVLFFLAKLGNMSWTDTLCNAHQNSKDELKEFFSKAHKLEKNEQKDLGFPFHVFLVDANTNILQAMRLVGLSYRFSQKLAEIFQKQYNSQYNKQEYIQKAMTLYKAMSSDDMAKFAQERFILKK